MNKTELGLALAKKNNITKQDAAANIDSILSIIENAMVENEKVNIVGFGIFAPVISKERLGRNPKTGEPVKIDSKLKIKFSASSNLKKRLNVIQ